MGRNTPIIKANLKTVTAQANEANDVITVRAQILYWYSQNFRPLPWRQSRDPYRIWISEIMLQQTTTTAVIPFYNRFMSLFPTVKALATAPLENVLEAWAGLGYYSRARNLHKCAQIINAKGFPQSHEQLIELPGLGPYTARAISSQAFNEKVGVVDGNVIRVLTRVFALDCEWWKTTHRSLFQNKADALAQTEQVSDLNQALMELGATICTPKSPSCLLCPLSQNCQAFKLRKQSDWPRPKPRKENEIWQWSVVLIEKNKRFFLTQEHESPFLKKDWLPPGEFKKLAQKPKTYDIRHSITHHDIFVKIKSVKNSESEKILNNKEINKGQWVKQQDVAKINPSSLIKKIFSATTD